MTNRIANKIQLPDLSISKVGVIYVYYERKNEQKNQTNLAFFLKYALNNKIWQNIDINYLFIINGYQCEVSIPEKPNVDVLKEYNCHDWEAYANGIRFYEEKFNKKIWEIFDYLCLVNCSVLGPIYESSLNTHWLSPFYNKMKKDNSVACSPCMSFLPETDGAGLGPRLVATFTFIRINEEIINLLMNTKISYCDETSKSPDVCADKDNTVLGVKYSKNDAVYTGEYGISRVLLKHNYNITSLLYDNIDIYDKNNWNINNNIAPDRFNTFNGENIPLSTVFIKNIWRWDDWYASYPVLYDECMEFVFNKCNMKNIFSINNMEYNYDLLYDNFYNNKALKFDRIYTETIYNRFNRQDEIVLFNKPDSETHNCVIYSHYDEDNSIKDYVIQGLKSLIYLGYDIIFLTTCTKIENIYLLPFEIIYIEKTNELQDWNNWLIGCNIIKQNNLNYKWILFLDNRILFPINGLVNFKNTVINIRSQCDFWCHWENYDSRNLLEPPIEFKFKLIDYIMNYIHSLLVASQNNKPLEIDFINYLIQNGFTYKINVCKEKLNIDDNENTIYNPIVLCQWIYDNNTFAVNWELCKKNLQSIVLTPEFNYLTRYLHHE